MSIEIEIAAWDGKSADYIAAIFSSHHKQPKFVDTLIKLAEITSYQKGATWLLKAWLEDGNKLNKNQVKKIYRHLENLEHWEARLHMLQCLPFMPIGEDEKKSVEAYLRTTLTDSNKFVRAWTYNGFYELAKEHPEFRNETKQFFEMAMKDESASVKARIRNLLKKVSNIY